MCKLQFLKYFDFFGYIPQFRIKGSERFTSKFGGLIFLVFIIITLGFILFQIYSFITTLSIVKSSMIIYKEETNSYSLTRSDTYFGISLREYNGAPLNLTKYPFLDIKFSFVNYTNNIKNETVLQSDRCNIKYFLYDFDLKKLENRKDIEKSLVNEYTCISEFKQDIKPTSFREALYFSVKVNVKENYRNQKIFYDFMKNINPKVSFIYTNFNYNTMNKLSPYFSRIEETTIDLDINVVKSTEFKYKPFQTLDNDDLVDFNNFEYFKNKNFSLQQNGTVFQLHRDGDEVKIFDTIFPESSLLKLRLKLSNTLSQNYRSFKHIQDLISIIGSFLPNIYLVFLVFANTVNQVKGKNVLMSSIYSNEIICKLKEFQNDHNVRRTVASRSKSEINEIETGNVNTNQNELKIKENNKDIELVAKEKGISFSNLDDLFGNNQSFKFTFLDYIKSLFKNDQKSKLMKNAYLKFDEAIEIDAYLYLQQEFDFYKELFMDNHQRLVFETASRYKNFRRLFEPQSSTGEYTNLTIQESITRLFERKNENDKILINYLEN